MKILILSIILLASSFSILLAKDKEHLFVVSGVIVNSNSSKKIKNFVDMIGSKSDYKLKAFYVNSYARLSEVLRDHPDALGWTCGAPFVEDSIKDGQQLVAVPLFHGVPTYSSLIITRKSEKGKKLSDFKSKIFVYSDIRSNSAFVAPSALLKDSGYDMDTFFRLTMHTGVHERSLEAIYRGIADIGAIDEYVWVEYLRTRPYLREKLHVIQKIGPFPFTPIVAGKALSKATIKKIQSALIHMNKKELTRFKKDFSLDGFVIKSVSFYEPIKKNMIKIGIDLQE